METPGYRRCQNLGIAAKETRKQRVKPSHKKIIGMVSLKNLLTSDMENQNLEFALMSFDLDFLFGISSICPFLHFGHGNVYSVALCID